VGSASIKATYLPQTEGIVTLNLGVSTGNGDAYEVVSTGVSKADARRVYLGKNYMLGYHFEGVSIPKGAVVVSTKLLQYCVSYNDKAISLGYVGEASGNPAPYGSVKHALSSRPKTLAMVTEQPATWSKESFNESADLRDILQEIVNRPDWVAGNAVNLYVLDRNSKSTRYLSHFEDSAGKGAQLKIQWRMP
jgi:type IV pilus assembly protein PilY1